MKKHNELLFSQQHLLARLQSLCDQASNNENHNKIISLPITHRIREKQDRLKSVKLVNKTLNTCKQHIQCVIFHFKTIHISNM